MGVVVLGHTLIFKTWNFARLFVSSILTRGQSFIVIALLVVELFEPDVENGMPRPVPRPFCIDFKLWGEAFTLVGSTWPKFRRVKRLRWVFVRLQSRLGEKFPQIDFATTP